MQQNGLYLLADAIKGRGVYAGVAFSKGDTIEICPIIELSSSDRQAIHKTQMHDYYFVWGENGDEAAISLGYGSLYNHCLQPNAQFITDYSAKTIIIECVDAIQIGDEILLNYSDGSSKANIWFEVH